MGAKLPKVSMANLFDKAHWFGPLADEDSDEYHSM